MTTEITQELINLLLADRDRVVLQLEDAELEWKAERQGLEATILELEADLVKAEFLQGKLEATIQELEADRDRWKLLSEEGGG